MGNEPDRKEFLDELFEFMQSQGSGTKSFTFYNLTINFCFK